MIGSVRDVLKQVHDETGDHHPKEVVQTNPDVATTNLPDVS